ncbi:MAG: type I restriction endonuclease subunit R [Acidobacteria bacterium]|nr:type I restriction endonuclease subunit R [Acidobacteriota bacterium]
MKVPSFLEDHISQIPALQLLQNMGYTYLRPAETYLMRGGKLSNVLLENILEKQLRRLNKIRFKGAEYDFSDANIKAAIDKLKDVPFDGLVRTSEKIYDLLSLGESFEQTINGDKKSFSLSYIDWGKPENNVFHVSEEFEVERTGSYDKRRPDIVLFVNGIPFVVIECKRPDEKDSLEQAISQHLRNQRKDEIPHLFTFTQMLLAVNKNEARYATTGTAKKFWANWREREDITEKVRYLINKPLNREDKDRLFGERFAYVRHYFDDIEAEGRQLHEQDCALYSLYRPDRLLDLTYKFIVFDAGQKKIARYQQYFTVGNTLERVHHFEADGNRKGGVIWHTQGSGKSLTMVMLAKVLALDETIKNPRIVLVTDRVDLDDQIYNTFRACGKEPVKAKTGEHLFDLLSEDKEAIITTLIHKFENVVEKKGYKNQSSEIFVLVDEGHRSNYKTFHQNMRKTLPKACYIGFTGTPLLKKEKNTVSQFGGFIDTYNIRRAVEDKAVVPILYEGRHVVQEVADKAIDKWFEVATKPLTPEQRIDLKRKFSTANQLNKADRRIYLTAYNIGEHFAENWQGTWAKAQLACDSKSSALKFKKYLDEFGMVSSEVLISAPDTREGNEDVTETAENEIQAFWSKMMERFGTEEEYNKQIINQFKNADEPEIVIVVDKLLTGFDAPRNTVLYITRNLKEHKLLQAIARVNRLYEGKDFGYVIDYFGVLKELGEAMEIYGSLAGFDADDVDDSLTDIKTEIDKLPQRHSELLDIFKTIKNKLDEEEYELFLADEAERTKFYEKFSAFNRTLGIALSSFDFNQNTPEDRIKLYKKHLGFFQKLRASVKSRYAETVDYKEYEAKVQKLIDTHVSAEEVLQIVEPVNIFEQDKFQVELDKLKTTAARADTIAHRTKKTISEKMEEDPYFYRRFSKILEEAIEDFRLKRLSEANYLKQVTDVMNAVLTRDGDDFPAGLRHNENAKAFFGVVNEILSRMPIAVEKSKDTAVEIALEIDGIISRNKVVDWLNNSDAQNRIRNEVDDYLYSVRENQVVDLDFDAMDRIIEESLEIARKGSL